MEPDIADIEKGLKEAFSLLKPEDLDGIRTAKIMLFAKRARRGGRVAFAAVSALACSVAAVVLLLHGSIPPETFGDNTVYIEGVHEKIFTEGRLVVFKNASGELVEGRRAELPLDLNFEGVLAAASVSDYFDTEDESKKRLYGLWRLYDEFVKEKDGDSEN